MSTRKTKSESENATNAARGRKTAAADSPVSTTPKAIRTRRTAAAPSEVSEATDTYARLVAPTHDDIARRAYFIAVERGGPGDPVADWLLAEQQLRQL